MIQTPRSDWADRTEQEMLDAMLQHAGALGWNALAVKAAARDRGLSPGDVELLAPQGPADFAALLSRRHDARALEALAGIDPAGLKMRERIFRGVQARLEAAALDQPATGRWVAFLARPTQLPLASRLVWESADVIWRWAGDTATDENHYSKRAILSGILIPALSLRLHQGPEAAEAFVSARIENVMSFEKWKAGIRPSEHWGRLAGALGRMRYGS